MTEMAPSVGLVTPGWKYQMNGSITRPAKAVKTSKIATLLSLKNRSTRYLSKCTEMAHSTGPENAKKSQDIFCCGLVSPSAVQHSFYRCRSHRGPEHSCGR